MARQGDERFELGRAGASARREGERRRAARERRVGERHPRLGGVVLAFGREPASERAWERGAAGEERVAEVLARHLDPGVRVLHDRRIPGRRANIDHIALAASGVWVIDAKRYHGRVAIARPLVGSSRLKIAGRDRSRLADGLGRQVAAVERALAGVSPRPPVHGVLCFVEAQLPLVRTLRFAGFPLLHPRPLARRIGRPFPEPTARPLLETLAGAFPPA